MSPLIKVSCNFSMCVQNKTRKEFLLFFVGLLNSAHKSERLKDVMCLSGDDSRDSSGTGFGSVTDKQTTG